MKLSMAQTQVYIDQVMNPDTSKYNMGGYMSLVGNLDRDLFVECVNEAIVFNDAFRVEIQGDITQPEQQLNEAFLNDTIEVIDFSDKGLQFSQNWIHEEFQKPMNFIGSRLHQIYVVKVTENEHWLVVKIHHTILDGYGFAVFLNRIASNYMWLKEGRPLPDSFHTPFSFLETIEGQNNYLESSAYERDEVYWRERMLNVEHHSLLNKDARFAHKGQMRNYELSTELDQNLFAFCQRTKSGIQDILMSACAIYFNQKSGASDICFGTPIHGRRSFKEKNTVGLFVHLIPVRLQLHNDMTVSDLVSIVQGNLRSDYRHSRFPLKKMFEFSGVKKSIGAPPFEVVVKYDEFDVDFDYGDVKAEVVQIDSDFIDIPFTIKLKLIRSGQPHVLSIQGRTDIFSTQELDEISSEIQSILNQICLNPEQVLAEIVRVSDSEREKILNEFSCGSVEAIQYQSIVSWFDDRVLDTPDLLAIYYEGSCLTYRELNRHVNVLASRLLKCVDPQDKFVGVMQDRSHFLVVSILAVMKAGFGYVPLDPAYPSARLNHMVTDSKIRTILCDGTTKNLLSNLPQLQSIEVEDSLFDEAECDCQASDFPRFENENKCAYLIYTSGSTGVPKAVVLHHLGLCNVTAEQIKHFRISAESRILQFASASFDASVSEIFTSLLSGACLYILPKGLAKEFLRLSDYVESHQITHATLPPTWLNQLNPRSWKSLQVLVLAGESFSYEVVKPWMNGRTVLNAYGPTEGTICTTIGEITGPQIHIGRPIANVNTFVLDEHLRVIPKGSVGELYIAGAGLAHEYLNRPELTSEKFFTHSFEDSDDQQQILRMYKTGDLVKWTPEGNLEYIGRRDRQVKIRGFRIELQEIEYAVRACDGVIDALITVSANRFGENSLVAYLIKDDTSVDISVVQKALRAKLPEHMIPAAWMILDEFPLTINGKVDLKKLPPVVPMTRNDSLLRAPSSPIEKMLANAWQEILDIEKICLSDYFFEIGGDSISATRLVASIARETGVQITVQSVFNFPTLQEQADYLQILIPSDLEKQTEAGFSDDDEEDMESFEL